MSPMETKQAHTDGSVSDGIIEYYRRRAEGGVGLIMVEAAYVHPTGKGFSTQLAIDRDEMIEGLSRIPENVHPYGAKVAIQLIHHGRQTESTGFGRPSTRGGFSHPLCFRRSPSCLDRRRD